MPESVEVQRGLQDVVALESRICYIDGKRGRLLYRGYDIRDLAARASFEEVAYLLWHGQLPTVEQLRAITTELRARRALPARLVRLIDGMAIEAHPMDVLRTAVSAFAMDEPTETRPDPSAIHGALRLTAALPTILGQFHRRRTGRPSIAPRPELSHAAYLIYALLDREPTELDAREINFFFIVKAYNEIYSSTFAARVTASTLSDLYSAVTSAVGALKGPLHGGANERVMELVREIGSPARVAEVVREKLARHERIMGFGHRVYKVEDPRAAILREWSRRIGEANGDLHYFEILRKLEEVVHGEKGLFPNVDLYSGSIYSLLGVPNDLFTPIFAASRVAGWTAHVLEEYEDLRLIRPTAKYVGAVDLGYVPIGQRR